MRNAARGCVILVVFGALIAVATLAYLFFSMVHSEMGTAGVMFLVGGGVTLMIFVIVAVFLWMFNYLFVTLVYKSLDALGLGTILRGVGSRLAGVARPGVPPLPFRDPLGDYGPPPEESAYGTAYGVRTSDPRYQIAPPTGPANQPANQPPNIYRSTRSIDPAPRRGSLLID